MMEEIVTASWLNDRLQEEADQFVLIDARYDLADSEAGKRVYEKGHLPGAVFLNLGKELAAPAKEHGGRHPMPEREQLEKVFGGAGISADKKVVIYDDQGGMMASRVWWMLKHLGHRDAAILDGGFTAWKEAGYEVTTDISEPAARPFQAEQNSEDWPIVDVDYVKAALENEDVLLIDSREPKRYRGEEEPIDPVAGHIPGALNYFWKEVLADDGTWKKEDELKAHFAGLPSEKEIVVYCGSGISACPNVLALKKAGFRNVKLYAGSWSDWISYQDNPVAKGES
ncbi:sulfurtransferase [Halalkalibacter oceani]